MPDKKSIKLEYFPTLNLEDLLVYINGEEHFLDLFEAQAFIREKGEEFERRLDDKAIELFQEMIPEWFKEKRNEAETEAQLQSYEARQQLRTL